MKIPPIDLSKIIQVLKSEGRNELCNAAAGKFGKMNALQPVLAEWSNILTVLERELIPVLKNGGELSTCLPIAKKLSKSVASLSLMASQILSFIPGPIGIVCSLINAIVCFCSGNIPGGLIELIGCIPGAKVGIKGSSKVATKIGDMVLNLLKKNPNFSKYLQSIQTFGKEFNAAKVKNIISDIKKNLEPTVHKLGTGRSQPLSFDPLIKECSNTGRRIQNVPYSINNKGIRNYEIGYGMNPQQVLWPK